MQEIERASLHQEIGIAGQEYNHINASRAIIPTMQSKTTYQLFFLLSFFELWQYIAIKCICIEAALVIQTYAGHRPQARQSQSAAYQYGLIILPWYQTVTHNKGIPAWHYLYLSGKLWPWGLLCKQVYP